MENEKAGLQLNIHFFCRKYPPANAGDTGDESSVPGLGRFPGEGNGNPLRYSCLEKSHGQRSLVG